MRVLRGVHPIAASLTLMSAVTVVLWQVKINTTAHHLVYFYLLPIALIAVLYNGRTAVLCAAIALVVADYFLEDPIYSLVDNDLREFGDLVWFALLAVTAIKFIRVLAQPTTKSSDAGSRYGWS